MTDPEAEYVEQCPACGEAFVGMTPEDFRRRHARECPNGPLGPFVIEEAARPPSIADLLDAAWRSDR